MPVEVEKLVWELAKNGKVLAILVEDDEPSVISVQIEGVVYEEENIQPQGTGNTAHRYMNADEAEYDDGQDQVLTGVEAEELESEDFEHDDEDHDGPLVPPTVEVNWFQWYNEDESPTIEVYDVQGLELSKDGYEADYDADAVEEGRGKCRWLQSPK